MVSKAPVWFKKLFKAQCWVIDVCYQWLDCNSQTLCLCVFFLYRIQTVWRSASLCRKLAWVSEERARILLQQVRAAFKGFAVNSHCGAECMFQLLSLCPTGRTYRKIFTWFLKWTVTSLCQFGLLPAWKELRSLPLIWILSWMCWDVSVCTVIKFEKKSFMHWSWTFCIDGCSEVALLHGLHFSSSFIKHLAVTNVTSYTVS